MTFSIVAFDAKSGMMGVAVQSHWFSVGSVVTWAEAGVGVVATQAMVDVSYGPLGLEMMSMGMSAAEALKGRMMLDGQRDLRQVAMIDWYGRVAVHTGERCIACAGHEAGEGFSVQANMMANDRVWPAMAMGYRETVGELPDRMLAALEAGQAVGGDVRGQQSAAILVVKTKSSEKPWENTLLDLRVEDHNQPVAELKRLIGLHKAYSLMNMGDDYLGKGKIEDALNAYRTAASMASGDGEIVFWQAVTLVELDRMSEALPLFKEAFKINPGLVVLVPRLAPVGILQADPVKLQKILSMA
jgi:uncharacterized Ntn-hydrolase superfamily protein